MINETHNDNSISLVCSREGDICGEKTLYRLIKLDFFGREVYAVTVSFGKENAEVIVGESEENARKLFLSVYKNSVTPCTFLDIVSDFNSKIQ